MRKMRRERVRMWCVKCLQRRRRMKKLISSQMQKQSRRFMSCFRPIQSEKENSSNSHEKKANTGLGIKINNT